MALQDKVITGRGICPSCKSKDVEYLDSSVNYPQVYYEVECNSCKEKFDEVYVMAYDFSKIGDFS